MRQGEPEEDTGGAVGTAALGSQGDTDIELESSPEEVICGRKEGDRYSCAAWSSTFSQGKAKSTMRGVPSGRQGEPSCDKAGRLTVS